MTFLLEGVKVKDFTKDFNNKDFIKDFTMDFSNFYGFVKKMVQKTSLPTLSLRGTVLTLTARREAPS